MLDRRKREMRGQKQITPRMVRKAKQSEKSLKKLLDILDRFTIRMASTAGIKDSSVTIDDLVQEGQIVALKCIKKYDPERDTLFTTFYWEALRNHFGHLRGSEKTQKRKLNVVSESLSKHIDEGSELIESVEDIRSHDQMVHSENQIFLKEILELLPPEGYMLCRFYLRGWNFKQIANHIGKTPAQVRKIFKTQVKDVIQEAKKLGIV